jgi:hypothetical protein
MSHLAEGEETVPMSPDEFGRDGVDRHRIPGGQHGVLDVGHHAARARTVTRERAVHHAEHPGMDLALDHEEIDKGFVNDLVRPVPLVVEQTAESVLHRPGHGGKHMSLHGRQLDNIVADETPGNDKTFWVDPIQHQELAGQVADGLLDRDPLFSFVQVNVAQAVAIHHVKVAIFPLAFAGRNDDRAIVVGVKTGRVVSIRAESPHDPFQLPGGGTARREEIVPGDVHLQRGLASLVEGSPVPRQVHQPVVVVQDRFRSGLENRDSACHVGHLR